MKYLSGASGNEATARMLAAHDIGLMCQVGNSLHRRIDWFPFWAADIGMRFNADTDRYLDYLDRLPRTALFVVSPDAYPDPVESQRRGLEFAPIIREMGFKVAVVAQTGAEDLHWPWDELDCLFLGGTKDDDPKKEWKISAAAEGLAARARNAGKQVHMGRCQPGRLLRARQMGCTSMDGTYIKYGPDINVPKLIRGLNRTWATQPLPIFERFESLPK
jgi:hypothetical protein